MPACATCTADNRDELEALGLAAKAGDISWREAARQGELSHHVGLKNHMERHYVAPEVEAAERALYSAEAELAAAVDEGVQELLTQAALSPTDVKPLLLTAAHNLRALLQTKPSQQHLIQALKTVQDITGMKQEQRLLLDFARAMGVTKPQDAPAIEAEHIDEAEVVE